MILSLYYSGRYEEAAEFAQSRMALSNNYFILDSYGFLMLNTGNYQEAIQYFKKAIDIEGFRFPRMLGWMGASYARNGEREKSLEIVKELKVKKE